MKYRVIKMFTDLKDNNFRYNVGDIFPRSGFEVSESRINELSSNRNRQGMVLIEKIPEPEKPKQKK